ncbi:hypothetical protein BKA93DRAFT_732512 [Sparassis latifolia]|uniref:Uncharacterized protein n=1 Tax=Sparassis crispa TaxID=139825 RepID=A0A401GMF8_9APHY|nr:hypothetical protein SCP_0503970 [Sparassis crispa]GBE83349.1 hypothetical protein SCP_0503970 [Sparassis crispa]
MCEILSLSVLQVVSVLSFLTSILAVLCVGSGSLYRLSHRLDAKFEAEVGSQLMSAEAWKPLWNWSGFPVSFSLGSIVGEDEKRTTNNGYSGYIGGGDLVRMNWQVSRQRSAVSHIFDIKGYAPISMAKIIMSRHSQRRPLRLPRRAPGMPRPTPPSRLMESTV